MKSFNVFLLAAFIVFAGCRSVEVQKISLLGKKGLEKPDVTTGKDLIIPYSKAFQPYKGMYLLKNKDRLKSYSVGLPRVKLDPSGIYQIRMLYAGKENSSLLINAMEFAGENILKTQIILRTVSFLNVNSLTLFAKDFALSPECTEFAPVLIFINPGAKGQENQLLIKELDIVRTGTMKKAPAKIAAVNLAAKYDLNKLPEGKFKGLYLGNGPNAKKWSNVKANVIKKDGEKVLHIVRAPQNYIYPWLYLENFPIDPQYHFVRYTFKVKGTGSLRPGLWWYRPTLSFDYHHGAMVQLTDQWQTVTYTQPCLTPDVRRGAISFTSKGDGEFFIKDIAVHML